MSHEIIEGLDKVFSTEKTWHGLEIRDVGTDDPRKIAEIILPWEPKLAPVVGIPEDVVLLEHNGESFVNTKDLINSGGFSMRYRDDTNQVIPNAVVQGRYESLANKGEDSFTDIICELASEDKTVKIASIGSFNGGEVVFASIFLDSFGVGLKKADETQLFADFVNGHSGRYRYHAFPSATRMICANTVAFAVEAAKEGVSFKHTKSLKDRIVEAKMAILGFKKQSKDYAKQATAMSKKALPAAELVKYFTKIYERQFGSFVIEVKNLDDERKHNRQEKILGQWLENNSLDEDNQNFGIQGTTWCAFNAVTKWAEHQKTIRCGSENESVREAHRKFANMFGDAKKVKQIALEEALAIL